MLRDMKATAKSLIYGPLANRAVQGSHFKKLRYPPMHAVTGTLNRGYMHQGGLNA